MGRDGILRIPLPAAQFGLVRADGGGSTPEAAQAFSQDLFKRFDANNDGLLDAKEIIQPPFTFVALLRLADRDGDGKLSPAEVAAFARLQAKVRMTTTLIVVADRGRTLFELLDADRDGRLGPRELRNAWERLAPWDGDGDGCIAREEVPRQFLLTLTHGQLPAWDRNPGLLGYGPTPLDRDPRSGPLWFRKMDRNGDGDLAPREFLGPAAEFRRLDADGDGLISRDEAERADRELRKR